MCGIGGIVYRQGATPRSEAVLQRFATALAHRGPNGMKTERLHQADLIHTRLSIIDLEGGDQPIHAGSAAMVANGEIYNDPDLRAALGPERYTTGSDCESALLLSRDYGADFVSHLRGMYAIAIYDEATEELLLARDPFGIKPLYYAILPAGIAFASETGPLIAAGLVRPGTDPMKRDELLQLQFTTGSQTIFPDITRVLPGETIVIRAGEIVSRSRQPALPKQVVSRRTDEQTALKALDHALMDSVRVHERADVPFGLFLSGGVDSSVVLAAMSRLRREAGQTAPLLTWTAAFDTSGVADESGKAAALARAAGAVHETVRVTQEDFWRFLPAVAGCMDDPVADYATLPTWLLARKAREHATVILSGEGGDELFAGYGRYRRAVRPWWRGGRKMRRKGIFDGLNVLSPVPRRWRDGLTGSEKKARAEVKTPLSHCQAVDVAEWLPNDLLLKLDRCLMDHGLEGRTPLLDPVVARVAWELPDALRVRGKTGKYLLRRWLEQQMPEAQPFARKQGFTVPVGEWIAQEGRRLAPLMARQSCLAAVAPPEKIEGLFRAASGRKTGTACWTLLFYALWHRIHLDGADRNGSVTDVLS